MISFKTSYFGTVTGPTSDYVRHSLFEDPAAWSQTPDALLCYSVGSLNSKLLIAYAANLGYYVQYIDGSLWILVCDTTNIDEEVVEIDQDYNVSKGLLCDRDTTWHAVEWFLNNGERCPALNCLSDFKLPEEVVF